MVIQQLRAASKRGTHHLDEHGLGWRATSLLLLGRGETRRGLKDANVSVCVCVCVCVHMNKQVIQKVQQLL